MGATRIRIICEIKPSENTASGQPWQRGSGDRKTESEAVSNRTSRIQGPRAPSLLLAGGRAREGAVLADDMRGLASCSSFTEPGVKSSPCAVESGLVNTSGPMG